MLQDRKKESRLRPRRWGGSVSLYLMLLPAVAFLLLFVYYPFVSGMHDCRIPKSGACCNQSAESLGHALK